MAVGPAPAASSRRREILDWQVGLQGKSPAEVLGVPADADLAAVKAAFKALVRRFHPDALGEADAHLRPDVQAILIRVTEAYREMQRRPATPGRPIAPPAERPAVPREPASPPALHRGPSPAPAVGPSPPASRGPSPAPVLEPHARHARVTAALGEAAGFLANGDPAAAVAALHEVLGLADADETMRIRRLLSRAYVLEPKWRRYGASLLAEMLRQSPDDAETLATLGALYLHEGLLARAETTLRRALDSDPRNREAQAHLREVAAAIAERQAGQDARPPERRGLVARLFSFAR